MSDSSKPEKSRGTRRWVVLVLMSLVIFANYYLYDCFSTLKGTLQTELGASSTQWGLVRNFYNVPNTFLFMALLGGIFLDRFGIRRTGFVFTLLCGLGGIVTAYGASQTFLSGGPGYDFMSSFLPSYSPGLKMMMFGRLLFGLGAETQIVMLNKVLAKWFMGKELALAFGLNLGFARLGSALGMSMSPRMASAFSFNAALWLGAVVMLSGVILFLIFMSIDYAEDKRTGEAGEAGKLADDEVFRLKDILTLLTNKSYLLIIVLCASFYAVVFPFQDYLADLLQHTHGYDKITAGDFTSLIPYGAALFTILFGAFIDKKGKRATLMLGGAGLLVVSNLCFGLTTISPWVLIPLFGIAFSLVPSAMWPAVALIVDEKKLGTAYGLMTWMQNLMWWGMALAAGWVLDATNPGITPEVLKAGTGHYDYTMTMLAFAGLASVALVVAILLKIVDGRKAGHGLELPSAEAAALNEKMRAAAAAES